MCHTENKLKGVRDINRKIVCVCGMGLGSGLIIKMSVQKALERLGFKGLDVGVEVMDVSTAQGVGADILLTNNEFAPRLQNAKGKVIALQNLMNVDEIERKIAPIVNDWKK